MDLGQKDQTHQVRSTRTKRGLRLGSERRSSVEIVCWRPKLKGCA